MISPGWNRAAIAEIKRLVPRYRDLPYVAYYTGTATDVDGQVINPKAADDPEPFRGVAIDPADPPVFESQAAYLKRHGLFLRGEERRLPVDAFEPEVVVE